MRVLIKNLLFSIVIAYIIVILISFVFYFQGITGNEYEKTLGHDVFKLNDPLNIAIHSWNIFQPSLSQSRPIIEIILPAFANSIVLNISCAFIGFIIFIMLFDKYLQRINSTLFRWISIVLTIAYFMPTYIIILLTVFDYIFLNSTLPITYPEIFYFPYMLLPIGVLSFLYLLTYFHFIWLLSDHEAKLNYIGKMHIHKPTYLKRITISFYELKEYYLYSFIIIIPVILTGNLIFELMFSFPGISKILFASIVLYDFPVLFSSLWIVVTLYLCFLFQNKSIGKTWVKTV